MKLPPSNTSSSCPPTRLAYKTVISFSRARRAARRRLISLLPTKYGEAEMLITNSAPRLACVSVGPSSTHKSSQMFIPIVLPLKLTTCAPGPGVK